MVKINIKDKTFKVYINSTAIEKRIEDIATQINSDYKDKSPIFLGVLNGSFMFASDLYKKITITSEISFVKLASYSGTETTGEVKKLIGLNESLKGKDIIIIEDIVDTGITIEKLVNELNNLEVSSIKIATLLLKPESYKKNIKIDYFCFEIPNNFVVGYGLDYDGLGRNFPDIYSL
ncbi:MAG: hypoxanthine phosphoribosyltransferase [Bacteroidota bacterium]